MSFNMMKKDGLDARSIIMLVVIAILIIIIGFLVYLYYFGDNVPWLARKTQVKLRCYRNSGAHCHGGTCTNSYPVNKEGNTIKERFLFLRDMKEFLEPGSFAEFLRNHPLKNYGVPAYTYEEL